MTELKKLHILFYWPWPVMVLSLCFVHSINIDGKIKSVEVLACQKRYVPEKHYVSLHT